jgi:MFS family permease
MPLGSRGGWVAAMSLAQLISWGTLYYTFSLLMPGLERDLGLSRVEVSGAFSAALLASGLVGLPAGALIDRGRGRLVMAGGSLAAGLLLVAHAYIDSRLTLYLVWIGLGASMACTLYEPAFAILIRRWPKDYRRSLIAMTFLGGLASTVFVPLSAVLIHGLGWRDASLVLALLHLGICLPIHLAMLRGEPPPAWSGAAAAEGGAGAAGASPDGERRTLRALALSPAFLLITAFMAIFMAITTAMTAHMVPLLRERGLPEAWAIAVPASIGALQVFGRLVLFVLEGRIDVRHFDLFVPVLLSLSLGLLLLGGGNVQAALVFAAFFGIGNGLVTIVKATAIAQYVSRERVASLTGIQALPNALSRAIGPIMLAALWAASGDYEAGLWVLMAVGLMATLLLRAAQAKALHQSP